MPRELEEQAAVVEVVYWASCAGCAGSDGVGLYGDYECGRSKSREDIAVPIT